MVKKDVAISSSKNRVGSILWGYNVLILSKFCVDYNMEVYNSNNSFSDFEPITIS